MIDELEQRLRQHVNVLAEIIGERHTFRPTSLDAARIYLRRELSSFGVSVTEQHFNTSTRAGINLEVVLPGATPHKPALVIGAHYDTVIGTPGADDNASAVAILLEIVRAMSGGQPRRTVRFVFFDCEEPPHFNVNQMGSQHHAAMCRQRGEKLTGMICLESLGYFGRPEPAVEVPWVLRAMSRLIGGRHVVIASNLRSIPFWLKFLGTFVTSGFFPFVPAAAPKSFPLIDFSDHRGYWEQGYPAVIITDTALLRNPNYHTETDRLATLDPPRMTRLCRQLITCVRRLGGLK
jgi:hypothetical protein